MDERRQRVTGSAPRGSVRCIPRVAASRTFQGFRCILRRLSNQVFEEASAAGLSPSQLQTLATELLSEGRDQSDRVTSDHGYGAVEKLGHLRDDLGRLEVDEHVARSRDHL